MLCLVHLARKEIWDFQVWKVCQVWQDVLDRLDCLDNLDHQAYQEQRVRKVCQASVVGLELLVFLGLEVKRARLELDVQDQRATLDSLDFPVWMDYLA